MKRKFNTIEKDLYNLQTTSLLDDEDDQIKNNNKIIVSKNKEVLIKYTTPFKSEIESEKSKLNNKELNVPSYIN
jgi:hypothetical protein